MQQEYRIQQEPHGKVEWKERTERTTLCPIRNLCVRCPRLESFRDVGHRKIFHI